MKLSRNRQQQTIGKYFAAENGKKPPPGLVTNDKMKDFAKSFYLHLRLLSHSIWQLSRSISQTCKHTHSHSSILTHTHTHTPSHSHPQTLTPTYIYTHLVTHPHSNSHIHTHIHSVMLTNTLTLSLSISHT